MNWCAAAVGVGSSVCALIPGLAWAQPGTPTFPEGPASVVAPFHPNSMVLLLQHTETSVGELIDSPAGWKVVEPSVNGLPSGDLSPADVLSMKSQPERECRSRVLAYLSIGEAEDYRSYWEREWVDASGSPIPGVAPAWLGDENPEWQGNYKVRYWHRAWKDLLFGTPTGLDKTPLDRIIDQGFDGVYLDIIDAYEYWSDDQGEISRRVARERMVRLVEQITHHARNTRGISGFIVIAQNGEGLVLDDHGQPDDLRDRFATSVDGVAMEDLFFDGTRRVDTQVTEGRLNALRRMFENRVYPAAIGYGPHAFAIDYVLRGSNLNTLANRTRATEFRRKCDEAGLVAYAARLDRNLDEVVVLGGPRWTIEQPDDRCGLICPICLVGLDFTGSTEGQVGASVARPDGVVDEADATYFMAAFQRGDAAADLTGCVIEGQPGYGVPDGIIDATDLNYFLQWYARR